MMTEKKIYVVIDKKDNGYPIFMGTMSEVSAFTGKNRHSILSAISHAKKRGNYCKYGVLEDDEDDEDH